MKKRISLIIGLLVVVAMMAVPLMAFAADSSYSVIDSSGNHCGVDTSGSIQADKDFYWAGQDFLTADLTTGYDALIAGKSITISNSKIGGAARMAAQHILITETQIGRNATLAAQTISINKCQMDTLFAACQDLYFNGQAECMHLTGKNVNIAGKIDGDIIVTADTLTVEKGAEITGTIMGTVGSEPVIHQGAKVGNVDVKIDAGDDQEETESPLSGFAGGLAAWWFAASMLMWLAMRFFMKKPVEKAGQTMMTEPGKLAGVGAIVTFCLPVAAIVFMFTVIGIPISIIAGLLYTVVIMISVPFAGSAAGQAIFAKVTPRMNAWGSTAIGAAGLLILAKIPFLGSLIHIAALMFTIGYFSMGFYRNHLKKEKKSQFVEGGYVYATESEIHQGTDC